MPVPDTNGPAVRSLQVVGRAIERAQTFAMVYEHVASLVGPLFRGTENMPPKLLMRVPGGGAYAATVDDVIEIEVELLRRAADERLKIGRLLGAGVLARPEDVDRKAAVHRPVSPTPSGERVVENAAFTKVAVSRGAPR